METFLSGVGLWFLILSVVAAAVILIAAAFENGVVSSLAVILYAAVLFYLGLITREWIRDHPLQIVLGVAGYLLAGVVWMFTKWYWKVRAIHVLYTDLRLKYPEAFS